MSAIGRRMNHLKSRLLDVRNGPGAAILPPNITKIHLEFAKRMNDGHFGSRKFWQENLPRLKYHNPNVPMIVNRTSDQTGPATLTVYMRSGAPKKTLLPEAPAGAADGGESAEQETAAATAAATDAPKKATPAAAAAGSADAWVNIVSSSEGQARAPPPAEGETVVTINTKNVFSEDILRQLLDKTGARPVEPTEEDQAEMRRLAELKRQAEVDRRVQKAFRDDIKAEKKMLERARQEANALKGE